MSTRKPGWYRFAFFLGRAPSLTERQWRVLGLVAAVSFFEVYDMYLFTLNLKQIQSELGISEANLGYLGSIVRSGAIFSVFIALAADWVGRRRMLLITIVIYTLLTGLTALAPTAEVFVGLQFFARAFAVAEAILATVVIVEEFDAHNRGWGVGALGAIQACGAGAASILYGFVEVIPFGWRSLYAVGLIPLVLLAYWRRTLPETTRFADISTDIKRDSGGVGSMLSPILSLVRDHRRRLSLLALVVFLTALAGSTALFFAPKYLQDVHGWTPAGVALLTLVGGVFAVIGNPLAGWLSDKRGRRPVTAAFAFGMALFGVLFYSGSGIFLSGLWMGLIFFSLGVGVTESTYGAELFPTSKRTTASSARSIFSNIGAISGLFFVSLLYPVFESNWTGIVILSFVCVLTPVIVWVGFPETSQRELEEIAPEE